MSGCKPKARVTGKSELPPSAFGTSDAASEPVGPLGESPVAGSCTEFVSFSSVLDGSAGDDDFDFIEVDVGGFGYFFGGVAGLVGFDDVFVTEGDGSDVLPG